MSDKNRNTGDWEDALGEALRLLNSLAGQLHEQPIKHPEQSHDREAARQLLAKAKGGVS